MPQKISEHLVTHKLPNGNKASLRAIADHAQSKVLVWLEPGMHLESIVAFYRIYEQGVSPEESWQVFQDGKAVAPYAIDDGASLGAIELLSGGHYTIDVRLFTGHDTIELPSIAIELRVEPKDQSTIAANDAFKESFDQLFQEFFQQSETESDLHEYFDNFSANQLDNLFSAMIELGGPQDHCEDDYDDVSGFFNFIDYVTAIAYSCGEAATDKLKTIPIHPRTNTTFTISSITWATNGFIPEFFRSIPTV